MLTIFGASLVSGLGLGLGMSTGSIFGTYLSSRALLVIETEVLPERYQFAAQLDRVAEKLDKSRNSRRLNLAS